MKKLRHKLKTLNAKKVLHVDLYNVYVLNYLRLEKLIFKTAKLVNKSF